MTIIDQLSQIAKDLFDLSAEFAAITSVQNPNCVDLVVRHVAELKEIAAAIKG